MVGEEVRENYFPLGGTGESGHERDWNILSHSLVLPGILFP